MPRTPRTQVAGRAVGPDMLRQIRAAASRPAVDMIDAVPPSEDAVRAAIAEQKCPFCGLGPFKMLPVHTNKIHGVDKWELRDLAGLSTNDPLCSAESRELLRDAALRRNPDALARATEASRQHRRPKRATRVGTERNVATLTSWMRANPDAVREAASRAARSITAAGRARQVEATRKRHREHPKTPEQIGAFVERMHSPEAVAKRARPMPEHGTTARYKRGCRCEFCRDAKRASRRS